MSDDHLTPDERIRRLAADALAGYKAGKISLRQLIDDLDLVWDGLERSAWSDEFRGHWWTLEQIYAVALDRGEHDSLSQDDLTAIAEATAALEELLDAWITSMPNEQLVCRVCGLVQAEPPWGEDEATPSFDICDCCGVEFGYEDATFPAVVRYREAWIEAGAGWFNPRMRPADWDLDRQLANIPAKWRA